MPNTTRTADSGYRLRVPELRSPFPSALSPYAARAERTALSWAGRIGLVPGERALGMLARQGFGRLAGRAHPDATPDDLADVCRWYVWFAVLDDRYCDRPPPGSGIDWLAARLAGVARALHGEGDDGDPAAMAARDLAGRTAVRATNEQYRRLLAGFDATFFGLLWEAATRRPDAPVELATYIPMRRTAGALPAFLTLAEIYGGRAPPPEDVARPEVAALVDRLGNLIMWQNDIRSYRTELASGTVLSLVSVLEQERGGELQEAVDSAARMWTAEVDRYVEARATVRAVGGPELRRYADALHRLLAGFLTWPYETARYA